MSSSYFFQDAEHSYRRQSDRQTDRQSSHRKVMTPRHVSPRLISMLLVSALGVKSGMPHGSLFGDSVECIFLLRELKRDDARLDV